MTSTTTPMIGSFKGIFDGQNHKITVNINRTADDAALFENLYGTVQNLSVDGTITTSAKYAAGICAHCRGGKISGCMSFVNIVASISGDGTHAGICAVADGGGTVENCLFAGSMTGSSSYNNGGIVGWASTTTYINNCLMIADISTSTSGSYTICRNTSYAKCSNCYYKTAYGSVNSGATQVTDTQLASGEVAYLLNGKIYNGAWGQNITSDPKDTYPVIGGAAVNLANCDATTAEYTNGATSHPSDKVSHVEAVASTCSAQGNIEYWTCSNCNRQFSDAAMTVEVTGNTATDYLPHNYVNSRCSVCGALKPNADGIYEIETLADLQWFTKYVNGTGTNECSTAHESANGKLMADIDFGTTETEMIGTYKGIFDGNNHKITVNINRTADDAALFEKLYGTVQNLSVAGTITTNKKYAGGIAAIAYKGAKISNCNSFVNIVSTFSSGTNDGTHGGILGIANDGNMTVENCLFAGSMSGSHCGYCGGIVGWAGGANTVITNCLVVATFSTNTKESYTISRSPDNAVVTNCYYKNAYGGVNDGATQVTDEQLASGQVAYWLNEYKSVGAWGQNLTTDPKDTYPVVGGPTVYPTDCAGNGCTNDASTVADGHHTEHHAAVAVQCTVDGVSQDYWYCTVCGKYYTDADYTTETTAAAVTIPATGHLEFGADGKCKACGVAAELSLTETELAIGLAATHAMTVKTNVAESAWSTQLSWESSNTDIATVDANGKITTASNAGAAVIKVYLTNCPTVYATCNVTVDNTIIMLQNGTQNVTLKAGQTYKIYDDGGAVGLYSNYCNSYVNLTIPDGCYVNVSGNYLVENNCDYLRIDETSYKDKGASGSVETTETTSPFTVYFHSDVSVQKAGIDLTLTVLSSTSTTLNGAGYGTFSAATDLVVATEGVKAYKGTFFTTGSINGDTKIVLEEINGYIPAGTGVILYGENMANTSVAFKAPADGATAPDVSGNCFSPTTIATVNIVTKPTTGMIWALGPTDNRLMQFTGDAFIANRAYLQTPEVTLSAKGYQLVFADEIDGINSIENGELEIENAPAYNVAGQRVRQNAKGLVIKNGKKYFVK